MSAAFLYLSEFSALEHGIAEAAFFENFHEHLHDLPVQRQVYEALQHYKARDLREFLTGVWHTFPEVFEVFERIVSDLLEQLERLALVLPILVQILKALTSILFQAFELVQELRLTLQPLRVRPNVQVNAPAFC